MTPIARLLQVERERDALRAENLRYRAKLEELAKECASCDGTGVVIIETGECHANDDDDGRCTRHEPCGDCSDIREAIRLPGSDA